MKVEVLNQNNLINSQNTLCFDDTRTSSASTAISETKIDQNIQNTLSSRLQKLSHQNLEKFQNAYKNLKDLDLIVNKPTLKNILDLFQSAIIDDQKLIKEISIEQQQHQATIKTKIIAQKCFLTAKKLIEQNKLNRALQFLLITIEYNPSYLNYRMNLAILYIKLLKFSQALMELKIILNCNPNCIQAYWRNGDCLMALKRYSEAAFFYEQGLKLNSNNEACIAGKRRCSIRLLPDQSFYAKSHIQQYQTNKIFQQSLSQLNVRQIMKPNMR